MFDKYKEKIEKSLEEFKSLLNEEFKVISTDTSTGYSIEIASKGAKGINHQNLTFKIFQI